ncbi:MAG: HEAT repeat domain-containing protein [Planctomycetota bacterium]
MKEKKLTFARLTAAALAIGFGLSVGGLAPGAWSGHRVSRCVKRMFSEDEAEVRAAVAELGAMRSERAARAVLEKYRALAVRATPLRSDPNSDRRTQATEWKLTRLERVLPSVFALMGEVSRGPLEECCNVTVKQSWLYSIMALVTQRGKDLQWAQGYPEGCLQTLAYLSLACLEGRDMRISADRSLALWPTIALEDALCGDSEWSAFDAARELVNRRSDDKAAQLRSTLESDDQALQQQAVATLKAGAIARARRDGQSARGDYWRNAALVRRGRLGDPTALEPLLQLLKSDAYQSDMASVVNALGFLDDPRALQAIIPCAKGEGLDGYSYLFVYQSAVEALGRRKEEAAGDALRYIVVSKEFAAKYSGPLPTSGRVTAPEIGELRMAAMDALAKRGDTAAVETLIEVLGKPLEFDDDERRHAAFLLGQIGDKRAVAPLLALLSEIDTELVRSGVIALGRIGDRTAAEPVLQFLETCSVTHIWSTAWALQALDDERAVAVLIRRAREEVGTGDPGSDSAFIRALEKTDDPEALAVVDHLLPRSTMVRSPFVREILSRRGMAAFRDNWRPYLFKRWAEDHEYLFRIALRRYGTPEMARGYLDCYPWPDLRDSALNWAESHGCLDVVQEAR